MKITANYIADRGYDLLSILRNYVYPKHFRESTKSSQRSLKGDAFSFAQIQQNTEEAFVTNAICVHPPDKLKSKHMTKFPSWSPHNTHRYTKKHGKTFHAKCQHTYIYMYDDNITKESLRPPIQPLWDKYFPLYFLSSTLLPSETLKENKIQGWLCRGFCFFFQLNSSSTVDATFTEWYTEKKIQRVSWKIISQFLCRRSRFHYKNVGRWNFFESRHWKINLNHGKIILGIRSHEMKNYERLIIYWLILQPDQIFEQNKFIPSFKKISWKL